MIKITKKTLLKFIYPLLIIVVLGYMLGYRFTARQAAESYLNRVDKSGSQYIDQVNYNGGTVFIFDTDTVITQKHFPLWVAREGYYMLDKSNRIRVIGWGNTDKCTVYAVEIFDKNVSYIELGKEEHRVRKYKDENNRIIFSWDIQIPWSDLNGVAFSSSGQELYEFRYPKNTNTLRISDLRWYEKEE